MVPALVDAGCEYQYYASDITRTYPVNGRFTNAQREAYFETGFLVAENLIPGEWLQRLNDLSDAFIDLFGPVAGGADAVVDALLAVLGPRGTLVAPTFT